MPSKRGNGHDGTIQPWARSSDPCIQLGRRISGVQASPTVQEASQSELSGHAVVLHVNMPAHGVYHIVVLYKMHDCPRWCETV